MKVAGKRRGGFNFNQTRNGINIRQVEGGRKSPNCGVDLGVMGGKNHD